MVRPGNTKNISGLRIEIGKTVDELARHADVWDEIASRAPQRIPMLAHSWVSSYFEHQLTPAERWFCLFAYERDKLVGILPVIVRSHDLYGVRFHELRTPCDMHTRSGDALVVNGNEYGETDVFKKLLSELHQLEPSALCFEIHGVRDLCPTLSLLKKGALGGIAVQERDMGGSFVRIRGGLEDFRAQLGSNFAGNLRKARNKLTKLAGVEFEFIAGKSAASLEHLDRFLKVEASGWKGDEGSAILCSPKLAAFYSSLSRRFGEREWLEWHFLQADGRTIAGQLAVRCGRSLVILKVGYDESFSRCAPGNMLFEKTVERAFESGDVEEINCLTDMPWHRNWGMELANYYNVSLYSYRPLSLSVGAARRWVRPLLRKIPYLGPAVKRLAGSGS